MDEKLMTIGWNAAMGCGSRDVETMIRAACHAVLSARGDALRRAARELTAAVNEYNVRVSPYAGMEAMSDGKRLYGKLLAAAEVLQAALSGEERPEPLASDATMRDELRQPPSPGHPEAGPAEKPHEGRK